MVIKFVLSDIHRNSFEVIDILRGKPEFVIKYKMFGDFTEAFGNFGVQLQNLKIYFKYLQIYTKDGAMYNEITYMYKTDNFFCSVKNY